MLIITFNNNKGIFMKIKAKKTVFYTLGLGALFFGATQLYPSQNGNVQNNTEVEEPSMSGSSSQKKDPSMTHISKRKQAIRSLSPKNKAVFHTLSQKDQQVVVDSYVNGDGAQSGLNKVLSEDANKYNSKGEMISPAENKDSPANRSLKRNM